MKNSAKEQQRAEAFLQRKGIRLSDINSFCFMQRHLVDDEKHSQQNLYGPGLLTLQLKTGPEKVIILHVRNHPTSIIRTLLAAGKPFLNLRSPNRSQDTQLTQRYHRTSLYMIWFFTLFLACLVFGFYFATQAHNIGAILLAITFFTGSLYALYLLQTRFCHLRLDEKGLTIFSVGRSIHYPYEQVRKINFDFAREPNATHIMELLDTDYRYRLFYMGRTPRKSLNEITERLQKSGIDATCSLNDEKKHYHDVYHIQ